MKKLILLMLFIASFVYSDAQNEINGTQTMLVKGVEFKMIGVEGGEYMMGATEEQQLTGINGRQYAWDNEFPAHRVRVNDFMMSETVVTQKLWVTVMGERQAFLLSTRKDDLCVGDNYPMFLFVEWDTVQVFLKRLNELTGLSFRFPTEAEWEYAARGGRRSKGYIYAGSNHIDEVAWYSDSLLHEVALKAPNELGLYDMTGNCLEICSDYYDDSYYSISPFDNPQGPNAYKYKEISEQELGPAHVLRGGFYNLPASLCRISCRFSGGREGTKGTGVTSRYAIRLVLDW